MACPKHCSKDRNGLRSKKQRQNNVQAEVQNRHVDDICISLCTCGCNLNRLGGPGISAHSQPCIAFPSTWRLYPKTSGCLHPWLSAPLSAGRGNVPDTPKSRKFPRNVICFCVDCLPAFSVPNTEPKPFHHDAAYSTYQFSQKCCFHLFPKLSWGTLSHFKGTPTWERTWACTTALLNKINWVEIVRPMPGDLLKTTWFENNTKRFPRNLKCFFKILMSWLDLGFWRWNLARSICAAPIPWAYWTWMWHRDCLHALHCSFFLVLKANCAKSRWWDCLHALHCMFIFCIKSEFCEINMVLWHKIVQLWHCKHVNTCTLSTLLRTARFGQVKNSPALNGQWHKLSNLIDCGVKKSLPKRTNFPSFWVPCA